MADKFFCTFALRIVSSEESTIYVMKASYSHYEYLRERYMYLVIAMSVTSSLIEKSSRCRGWYASTLFYECAFLFWHYRILLWYGRQKRQKNWRLTCCCKNHKLLLHNLDCACCDVSLSWFYNSTYFNFLRILWTCCRFFSTFTEKTYASVTGKIEDEELTFDSTFNIKLKYVLDHCRTVPIDVEICWKFLLRQFYRVWHKSPSNNPKATAYIF